MVKTETSKKIETKIQDLKKFSRPRLGEFGRDETSRPKFYEGKFFGY